MDIKPHINKHLNQQAQYLRKSIDHEDLENAFLGSSELDFHYLSVNH